MSLPSESAPEHDATEGPQSHRVFFALWPDDDTRKRLVRATRDAVRRSGGRATPKERLHATVAFLGIHVLPPVNFNNEWALPNKLFDYVQARLGVVVGPSAEMAEYVRTHRLGVVLDDFSSEALTRALDGLDRDTVTAYKDAADDAAEPMSAEAQVHVWAECVDRLIEEARA